MTFASRSEFCLFQSALDLAHGYWSRLVKQGDAVVDATCGNGHDTLVLSKLCGPQGRVWAFDVQEAALEATRKRVGTAPQLILCHADHADLDKYVDQPVRLVVYNLGYLPGGDKAQTTCVDSTLRSVQQASDKLLPGGALSITCYPGHQEGAREQEALLHWAESLAQDQWSACHHRWYNRRRGPSLLLIQKSGLLQKDY